MNVALYRKILLFYLWFLESEKKEKLFIFLLYFEGLQYIHSILSFLIANILITSL